MTRIELMDRAAEKAEITKKEVEKVFDATITLIQEALKKGDKVSLTGIGTFSVVDKKARMARNPKTGAQVSVPAKKAAKFKAGKELKEILQ